MVQTTLNPGERQPTQLQKQHLQFCSPRQSVERRRLRQQPATGSLVNPVKKRSSAVSVGSVRLLVLWCAPAESRRNRTAPVLGLWLHESFSSSSFCCLNSLVSSPGDTDAQVIPAAGESWCGSFSCFLLAEIKTQTYSLCHPLLSPSTSAFSPSVRWRLRCF